MADALVHVDLPIVPPAVPGATLWPWPGVDTVRLLQARQLVRQHSWCYWICAALDAAATAARVTAGTSDCMSSAVLAAQACPGPTSSP